jgi:hypothetical protein
MNSDDLTICGDSVSILPRLDALPTGLLLEIFSYLAPRPSSNSPATGMNIEKMEKGNLNVALRNLRAVSRSFSVLVTPLIDAHYTDLDFYHVRKNGTQLALWEKVKTVILGDPCPRIGRAYFHEFLSLRDIDEQLGLSEAWGLNDENEDLDEGEDGEQEEKEPSVLDTEAFIESQADEYEMSDALQTNHERAAVLCLSPNVEEIWFGSYYDHYYRGYGDDKDIIAILPIIQAARGVAYDKIHRFEHLRYLSIDIQHMAVVQVSPVM